MRKKEECISVIVEAGIFFDGSSLHGDSLKRYSYVKMLSELGQKVVTLWD